MTTPDPTRGDPVTDPHDRPYTFGWHGEVTRRDVSDRDYAERAEDDLCAGMLMAGGCDRHDHATMPVVPVTRLPEPPEDADTLGDLLADLRNEYPRHSGDMDSWHLAEEILASGWLAERDRAIAERAWDECEEAAYYDPESRDCVGFPDNPYRKADQ